MKNNIYNEDSMSITDEMKENSTKYNLNKFDYDLHKEEDNVIEKVLRISRVVSPGKGERWKILEDSKVMHIIEGSKLNNKEKDFLRSVEGFKFLISEYKKGIKSFTSLRAEIKKNLT